MEDMRKFEKPEMEVIVFEAEDIITMSQNGNGTGGTAGASEDEFMLENMDGAADVTEPTVPTTSEGTAEATDSPSHVVDESVIDNEYGIEEPVMEEEVVEDIAIEE